MEQSRTNTQKIPANVVLAPKPATMDGVLNCLEKTFSKVDVCQGSRVRLVKAELETLQPIQQSCDFMAVVGQDCTMLREIFVGCVRI